MTQKCPFKEDISAFLDGELSEKDNEKTKIHLSQCKECQKFYQRIKQIDGQFDKEVVFNKDIETVLPSSNKNQTTNGTESPIQTTHGNNSPVIQNKGGTINFKQIIQKRSIINAVALIVITLLGILYFHFNSGKNTMQTLETHGNKIPLKDEFILDHAPKEYKFLLGSNYEQSFILNGECQDKVKKITVECVATTECMVTLEVFINGLLKSEDNKKIIIGTGTEKYMKTFSDTENAFIYRINIKLKVKKEDIVSKSLTEEIRVKITPILK